MRIFQLRKKKKKEAEERQKEMRINEDVHRLKIEDTKLDSNLQHQVYFNF